MPRALILCPTFDHADALFASIASVRAQSVEDWELVVIGDGAPARSERVVAAIARADMRIRAVWHPKSERFGEAYRDAVIRASDAEFVCHLSDDDLWFPDHLATMLAALGHADWANQAPLRLTTRGDTQWWPINHGTPAIRAAMQRRLPLSAGLNYVAYRREAYLRLPEGWTCAPWSAGTSDVYMWSKFFADPALVVASTAASTALKFPSHVDARDAYAPDDRLAELSAWLARLAEPGLARALRRRASLETRLVMLFATHDAASAANLDDAFARCGLAPTNAQAPPDIAFDGAPMALPINPTQRAQAERAWRFVQACVADEPAAATIPAASLYAGDRAGWRQAIASLQVVADAATVARATAAFKEGGAGA